MYWYKQDSSEGFKEFYRKKQTVGSRLGRSLIVYLFIAFLGVIIFFFYSSISHVDIANKCHIKLRYNIVSGNKRSIEEAIDKLKVTDYDSYLKMCRFVDVVYENDCIYADTRTDRILKAPTDGCYIRGSRAIMISPIKRYSEDIVNERVKQLATYSKLAAEYWVTASK